MNEDHGIFIGLIFTMAAIFVFSTFIWSRTSKNLINAWAKENGFKINKLDQPMFIPGPFGDSKLIRTNSVFRILVTDSSGKEKSGWIRSSLRGIDVIWNE
jgi:hypothetical protein